MNERPSGSTGSCQAPFLVDVFGRYTRDQLTQGWTDAPRPTTTAIEAMILRTWEREQAVARKNGRVLYGYRHPGYQW